MNEEVAGVRGKGGKIWKMIRRKGGEEEKGKEKKEDEDD